MLLPTLKQIGLEEKQAKIYLACLELGETSIKEIAHKAEIKRTTIYDLIDEMINFGYIKATTRGKRKRFIAADPDELKIILKKREALLDEMMPELKSLVSTSGIKPKMLFFEGLQGLREAYEDTLKIKNLTIQAWASEDIVKVLGKDWADDYIKRRTRKDIKMESIIPQTKLIKDFSNQDKVQNRKSKLVDPKKYLFNIEINIYDNKVAIMSAKDKIAVIIISEPIAIAMKMIFRMCWTAK